MTDKWGNTMNWYKPLGVAAAGLVLCGCVPSAGKAGAEPNSAVTAHNAASTASTGSAPAGAPGKPLLILNGQLDARPGQLVSLLLDGVGRAEGHDAVTAESRAFGGAVRLRWNKGDSAYEAVAPLAMTDRPGWYPLSVAVAGRTVATDRIQVVRSVRPSFTVGVDWRAARPGEPVTLRFDDLYPGEFGTGFTVRSTALPGPVRLAHDNVIDYYDPRAFSATPTLKPGLAGGSYAFELYGPHGRRIAVQHLRVGAARPGDPDYLGKAHGPDFYDPGRGYPGQGHHEIRVRAGGRVGVIWHDAHPDPGEETRLTATSPAFVRAVRLGRDTSKGADGDDPRYFGTATLRAGLKPGRYPVTVVSHHGRVTRTAYVIVTAARN
ncbi:hypothetical protein A6P39_027970 [Streptomyces sp. FXJ1.172]|uniref:hypothetical protein n=1 Tax=Streptomyces sp. FXJ1.172 TaxID=710705 RepID=UPI001F36E366|nr:hypothetical protein [Streptomyces sp. FXJ1.172]WEO97546.1 hypothetical protein A6P39_027970 [Streptomyces sp. FXJ1.172]